MTLYPRVLNRYTVTSQGAPGVRIDRSTKWGNPFPVTEECPRGVSIAWFLEWVKTQPQLLEDAKRELKGRNLLCTCTPLPCHGDFWLRHANGPLPEPLPFEHYRTGQAVETEGFVRLYHNEPWTLNEPLQVSPLIYTDAPPLRPLQGDETLYKVRLAVSNPWVSTRHRVPLETLLPLKQAELQKKKHDAVICLTRGDLSPEACRGALLYPQRQITAIAKVSP